MKKEGSILKFLILAVIIYGLISNFKIINIEIISSLKMWATVLIPSLFPYLVISKYIVQNGFPNLFNPLKKLISKIFNIKSSSAEVFLCSLLCGYPCGAICASDIYEKGEISKSEAMRLMCFTNGASPVFLICAVGGMMLKNTGLGIMMYAVQTLSSAIVGFILGLFSEKESLKKMESFENIKSASLTECCEKSVDAIINIAGYIIAATALGEVVLCLLSAFFGYSLYSEFTVYYFLEISKSMKLLSEYGSSDIVFSLMCACASFGGVSVIMQIFGVIDKSLKSFKFIIARISEAILSFILGLLFIKFENISFPDINPYPIVATSLIVSATVFFLFLIRKKQTTL